ncbi:unnamed protein product [Arabis nemorensis]|uniref:Uncharacterized protein n=1 Tax=Arabis nemorensis TaxID=586526 RepID=A0A565BI81_9BRAS|nr:unnamed protein product [Arabis nemorensis]
MGLPLLSCSSNRVAFSSSWSSRNCSSRLFESPAKRNRKIIPPDKPVSAFRGEFVGGNGGSAGPSGGSGGDFSGWDKIGAIVRLSYGIGIYCGMAVAGRFICEVAGIYYTGGFNASLDAIISGLLLQLWLFSSFLICEIVARAIRDVEDEELYCWHISDSRGIVALTGLLPPFVPFSQVFAATITSALTGSLYYIAVSPEAWYERRQMKKIYSPFLEGLLEWIQTNNLLAPIITHGIYLYSGTVSGNYTITSRDSGYVF